jgi:ABC-type multidrug transport system fused ATPase/permease subunit
MTPSQALALEAAQPSVRRDLKRLWAQLSRQRRLEVLVTMALTLTSSLAEMLSLGAVVPFLAVLAEPERIWGTGKAQWLAGWMGWQQPADMVVPLCLAFAGAAGVAGAVRIQTLRSTITLANGIGSDLSIALYGRTLYQPYAVHLQRNSSETISAISSQVDQVVGMLNGLLQLTSAGLVSLGLVAVLLWLNPGVTLAVAVVVGGGYGVLMKLSQRQLQRLGPAMLRDQTQLIRSLQEGLGAIRDVILDGSQPIYQEIYGKADRRLRRHRGLGQFMSLAPRYGMEAVGLVAIALAAMGLVAGRAGFLGALPLLGALALGAQRLLPSLQLIYSSWSGFRLNQPALTSVLGYLEQPVAIADSGPAKAPLQFHSEVRFQQLSFRYGIDLPWVLRDINLCIRPGERIGIVGETGSGKSTLVDLLMGLLEPTTGEILVDGAPVRGEQLRRWRGAIAHVPQSIFLADASIAENIAFGVPRACIDQARLEQASKHAQIASFIHSLADGYETRVGERGVRLSGGQRQRIGIARALYKQAAVIVFDEATSALDQATENEVIGAIEALSIDLTTVMIAHRLSTLKRCDRIINIKRGQLEVTETMQR